MLPATISNNVPGTDLSIGADTALNAIVEVRQSNRRQQSFERFVQDACAKTLNVRHDMKVQERKQCSGPVLILSKLSAYRRCYTIFSGFRLQ